MSLFAQEHVESTVFWCFTCPIKCLFIGAGRVNKAPCKISMFFSPYRTVAPRSNRPKVGFFHYIRTSSVSRRQENTPEKVSRKLQHGWLESGPWRGSDPRREPGSTAEEHFPP